MARDGRRYRPKGPPDEDKPFEENVVKIYRCSKVVKGGRRFSFGALVVVGDRRGKVGVGYGKANEVPSAVDKGIAAAQKNMLAVNLKGRTVPHTIIGRSGASKVVLVPASDGTGVIAGKRLRPLLLVRAILSLWWPSTPATPTSTRWTRVPRRRRLSWATPSSSRPRLLLTWRVRSS